MIGRFGQLLRKRGERCPVDGHPPGGVGGCCDASAARPAAQGVGADSEEVGSFLDSERRHPANLMQPGRAPGWPYAVIVDTLSKGARGADGRVSMGLEEAKASWRQVDRYRFADGELKAVDVSVEHQCRDGWVGGKGDAGEWPGADNPLDVRGEGAAGQGIGAVGRSWMSSGR